MKKPSPHLFSIAFITSLLFASPSMAQQKDSAQQAKSQADTAHPTKNFKAIDELPEPPGGTEAFYKYLSKHIKMPKKAINAYVQGTVYISMVVSKDGSITDVTVKQDTVGYGCAEEAVRVIKSMPKWRPGIHDGIPVSVRYTVPVEFKLH